MALVHLSRFNFQSYAATNADPRKVKLVQIRSADRQLSAIKRRWASHALRQVKTEGGRSGISELDNYRARKVGLANANLKILQRSVNGFVKRYRLLCELQLYSSRCVLELPEDHSRVCMFMLALGGKIVVNK